MTAGELAARLAGSGTLVVDVRSPDDYAAGHVPGAISLPLAELRDRLDELPREAEVIAYCGGPYCVVSAEAVRVLAEHGYAARTLDGGCLGWRRHE
ncbi:rhodanese-like domain-containing protein [Nonomuraea sp. B12E4]|uniref:rhodanese-like domain-containing protein n=1 Tax=Nonomuraea sp. B12E4 TaxID=3153564 RepID=UPI00325E5B8D